jgi:hypothetical protein
MAWVRIEIHEPSDRDGFEHIPIALEAAAQAAHRLEDNGEKMGLLAFSTDEFQTLLEPVNISMETQDASNPDRIVAQVMFRAYNKERVDAMPDERDPPDLRPA